MDGANALMILDSKRTEEAEAFFHASAEEVTAVHAAAEEVAAEEDEDYIEDEETYL